MNKLLLGLAALLVSFSAFSMQKDTKKDPCEPWYAMLEAACDRGWIVSKEISRVKELVTKANHAEEDAKARCHRAESAHPRSCEAVLRKVGGYVECPRMVAVVGGMPYWNFQECRSVERFTTWNKEKGQWE